MTDRELLELAAMAAGIDARRLPHAWPHRFDDDQWDPLIDDGDALRLAVKLELDIWTNTVCAQSASIGRVFEPEGNTVDAFEDHGEDPYAATRRAIVRAAAEIGRKMK